MAHDPKNLSMLAYANGFKLWHYTTTDTIETVSVRGYFDGYGRGRLRVGDMILANVNTDGTPDAGILLVNNNAGGVVDVASLTPVGNGGRDGM